MKLVSRMMVAAGAVGALSLACSTPGGKRGLGLNNPVGPVARKGGVKLYDGEKLPDAQVAYIAFQSPADLTVCSVDGIPVSNVDHPKMPIEHVTVLPGTHEVSVVRQGYSPFPGRKQGGGCSLATDVKLNVEADRTYVFRFKDRTLWVMDAKTKDLVPLLNEVPEFHKVE